MTRFYVATRDIDCEAHYFKDILNALVYVWGPMGKEISNDDTKSFEDSVRLYDKFQNSGNSEKMWELDAPVTWGTPYNKLGGFIEAHSFEDED